MGKKKGIKAERGKGGRKEGRKEEEGNWRSLSDYSMEGRDGDRRQGKIQCKRGEKKRNDKIKSDKHRCGVACQ